MSTDLPLEWFDDAREIEHVSQGDIFLGVPQRMMRFVPGEEQVGKRQREPIAPEFVELETGTRYPVVLCSHDCTFVAQPEGTQGYAHNFRVVAPVVPFEALESDAINRDALAGLVKSGYSSGLQYLPRRAEFDFGEPPDAWADHCAIALYRPYLHGCRSMDYAGCTLGSSIRSLAIDSLPTPFGSPTSRTAGIHELHGMGPGCVRPIRHRV